MTCSRCHRTRPQAALAAVLLGLALVGCEPTQPKPVAQDAAPALPTAAQRGTAVAPPATLAGLRPLVGSYPGERAEYLRQGALAERLQRLMGDDYGVLLTNLGTSGPLVQEGDLLYITGNKPHEGGDEQAAVVVDPAQNALRVWLVHAGQERDWRDPASITLDWPRDVRTMRSNRQELRRNQASSV
ncbi:hypothetical protein [Comamonas sp. UBA7528]|uniref:hypothetical protein n=1 Tax=Comamonas sp. UBA7528 TaxID=1946391 RepID=UPI001B70D7A7|nr:hypothetical protein [Comamonas sp. UBA7528]MBP7353026.1 hypothetical protein [Comamonas sp.]